MDVSPVQYVTTSDGFDIAYSVSGERRPLVFLTMRMSHLQLEWSDPAVAPWLEGLATRFRLIRYDSRGQGLSGRDLPEDFQISDYVRDLETVLDHLGVERAILVAHAVFGHVALRYAVAHSERVEALVLFPMARTMRALRFLDMARQNWDLFLYQQVGGAALSPERRLAAIERLRQTMTQRDFVTCTNAFLGHDIGGLLSQVSVPVLVVRPRDYPVYSEEESRAIAAGIAGATLVQIDGTTALGDAGQGLRALDSFVADLPASEPAPGGQDSSSGGRLSVREREVLSLLAAGKSNQEIADELVISLNTVKRHVSHIFDKTGSSSRAQAIVYARDHRLA
jgi:pimeloyl-ACP methyl ester carboxylesterase/DNA-binding CsgD family transcriptional regulator